jgi:4-hydroxy-3-polyprenylbenzoate decarboxylase
MARLVIIVDEDVDPSDLADVMWAIATRCEPSETVDIIRNFWSSAPAPRIDAADRSRGHTAHSKMIIDTCKPFAWGIHSRRFQPWTGTNRRSSPRNRAPRWRG